MRAERVFLLAGVVVGFCFGAGAQTVSPSTMTTLLPQASGAAVDPLGLLVQLPPQPGELRFDLGGLPPALTQFDRCTFRLVVKDNQGAANVIVKGRLPEGAPDSSIVNLGVVQNGKPVVGFSGPAGDLCKAIYKRYDNKDGKGKVFSVVPFTQSSKAKTLFHSLKSVGPDYSNVPRLVLEYKALPPSLGQTASWPQYQRDPEHTGRSSWAPAVAPGGFTEATVDLPLVNGKKGFLVDYPLIYGGNLYVIYKIDADNYLLCLDFSGKNKLWERNIGPGTVDRPPAIGPSGLLYAVTEGKIAAYDLNQRGSEVASRSLWNDKSRLNSTLTKYTDLTVGDGGDVFLALKEPSGVNFIMGFTPKLEPFIREGPFDTIISSVTVSEGGGRIFSETRGGAVVLAIANPVSVPPLELRGAGEYYHTPVSGPAGAIIFSAFKDMGSVWGYTFGPNGKFSEAWPASTGGITPQSALGSNGCLYFIQDGKLKRRGCKDDFDTGTDLKTSSNLVLDGANNIYFWSNGELQAYDRDGKRLFGQAAQELKIPAGEGLEKFIRLLIAPDGTLWANNRGAQSLYAFKPKYDQPGVTVSGNFRTRTVYRANDKLTVAANVTVPKGSADSPMQILFQAQNGISFSAGFKVEEGASLLCRTGF
ncbi:MAG TPA: hypothetical protein VG273_27995 [Bryobacteraceae bacterium]|nr:hypothetical protein [Bryobacteraceae bacterium]